MKKKTKQVYNDFSSFADDFTINAKDKSLNNTQFLFNYKYLEQSENNLENEKWVPIPKFENYLISNYGRIKALPQIRHLPYTGTYLTKEKLLKPYYLKSHGTSYVIVRFANKRHSLPRLVAQTFVEKPYGCNKLIFKDGNQLNILPTNLAWVDNETFTFYCGCYFNRKKLKYTKEFAIEHCIDNNVKEFYIKGDINIINKYWLEIRKQLYFRNFKDIESECYDYILDRLNRYSILGNLKGLVIMYSYEARKKLKNEISKKNISNSLKLSIDGELTQIANLKYS